jgi:hypothetical protein
MALYFLLDRYNAIVLCIAHPDWRIERMSFLEFVRQTNRALAKRLHPHDLARLPPPLLDHIGHCWRRHMAPADAAELIHCDFVVPEGSLVEEQRVS